MTVTDVLLDRETANDETALVVAVFVASGAKVAKDEPLFDIENSKATQEVAAPHAGIVTHSLVVGQTVEFGAPLAQINSVVEAASVSAPAVAAPSPTPTQASAGKPGRQHVSQAAAALMAELGLTSAAFGADFVTLRDVRAAGSLAPAALAATPTPTPAASAAPVAKAFPPAGAGQPVSGRKRAEIEVLGAGAGNSMLSVLGTHLGSMAVPRDADDFLGDSISDLVIYEAARLLRKYPSLNAAYADGQVVRHGAIHAGIAIDSGGQLLVYGIENADRLGLPEVAQAIAAAVGRYVAGTLSAAELTRATFTVTDLSAEPLDFVLPLLPRGQSCILGITRDGAGGYRIFAGFDHRVTEGREVAAFLGELRQRLQSFVPARPPAQSGSAPAASSGLECAYCVRGLAEAVGPDRGKGLLKLVDRDGRDILCCASCWNGW